jgi:hypothetical protein
MISSCEKNSSLSVGAATGFTLGFSTSMFAGMEMPRPVGDGLSGVAGEKQTLVWNWLIQESARQIFALCSSTQSIAQSGIDARTTRDW